MTNSIENSETFLTFVTAHLSESKSLILTLYEKESGEICIRFRPYGKSSGSSVAPTYISAEIVQQFIADPEFWSNNENTYVLMRKIGENVSPVTSLMSNFKKYYDRETRMTDANAEELDDILNDPRFVHANVALNLDLINMFNVSYVVNVSNFLASKFTTYSGKAYVDGIYSSLDIFTMLFKQKFFSASFLVASKEPGTFNTWTTEKHKEGCHDLHNVRIVIDTIDLPNDCADIEQTKVMFQSYCGFEWMGMRMEDGIPIVQLKTIDTPLVQPKPPINSKWLESRVSEIQSDKCTDVNTLFSGTQCLLESHNRNGARNSKDFPLIDWANITK